MASKRKDAVALFEAISKTKPRSDVNMNVPAWMQKNAEGQAPQAAPADASAPASAPASTEPQATAEPATIAASAAPAAPTAPAAEAKWRPTYSASTPAPEGKMFSTEGGRLSLSLDYRKAGFVAAGAAVLLIVVFVLGRVSNSHPAPAAATDGNAPPMKPDVVQPGARPGTARTVARDVAAPGAGTAAVAIPAGPRVKGKYYIVIQGMSGKTDALKEEAFKIADFCTKHNLPADVAEMGSKAFIVWSMQPFDSAQDPQAKKYAEEIEKVGKLYKAAGGKYDFMQRKTHNGPLDPMLKQQP